MKRFVFIVVMLVFAISSGYSQSGGILDLRGKTIKPNRTESLKPKRAEPKVVKQNMTAQEKFDNYKLTPEEGTYGSINDRDYVKKGESFRIKFSFDPRRVFSLKLVKGHSDNPMATPKDLQKGEWIVEVTPEKSMEVSVAVENTRPGVISYDKRFILVIEPDKYDEVKAKFDEFKANKDVQGRMKYFRELGGEEYEKYLKKLNSNPFGY